LFEVGRDDERYEVEEREGAREMLPVKDRERGLDGEV